MGLVGALDKEYESAHDFGDEDEEGLMLWQKYLTPLSKTKKGQGMEHESEVKPKDS